jgi:hypothetical protein
MENENKNQVLTEVQSYLQSEYDIARLKVTRRAGILSGSLLMVICVLFLAFLMIIALAVGGTLGLMEIMPAWAVFLVMGGIFLLLIVALLLCRKYIFVNPMVKALSDSNSLDELEREAVRAEGNAALQRERLGNRVTAVQTAIDDYTRMFHLLVRMISRFF